MITVICPTHMISKRAKTGASCHLCGKEMIGLSYRTRVPKRNKKDWVKFIKYLKELNPYFKDKIENY